MPQYNLYLTSKRSIVIDAANYAAAATIARQYGVIPEKGLTLLSDTDLSRASIASELPPITGQERFIPSGTAPALAPVGPTTLMPPAPLTIGVTQAELQRITDAQNQGLCVGAMKAYYTVKQYNVGLTNGQKIIVEALDDRAAKQKALEAGYTVAYVNRRLNLPVRKTETPEVVVPTTTVSGNTVEIKDEMGGSVLIPKDQFDALPEKYQDIAKTTGWRALDTAMWRDKQSFEANNVELPDGKWIAKTDLANLENYDQQYGTDFAEVARTKGYNMLLVSIGADLTAKAYSKGELIALPDGTYISKKDFENSPQGTQRILKESGFAGLSELIEKKWQNLYDPSKILTDDEYKTLLTDWDAKWKAAIGKPEFYELEPNPRDEYHLAPDSARRLLISVASMIVPPAKAGLPEYDIQDVSKMDWAFAATNIPLLALGFAPGAIAGSTIGKAALVGLSAAQSGLISYSTVKSWSQLSPLERGLGVGFAVLSAIPLMTSVARNVKVGVPSKLIPTTEGEIASWKGLSVAGSPIIGKSGGKWVIGTRQLTLPEARLILDGYHPQTMLETKVFVNRSALLKAGFDKAQVDFLTDSLKARNLFAGKRSPWLSKEALIQPTQRLTSEEIEVLMRNIAIKQGDIKEATLLFGSPTIKGQIAPGLRNWRPVHDWDIKTAMSQADTEIFAQKILKELEVKGGAEYRMSPKSPTLIEKKIAGAWDHIADIHSQEIVAESALDLPGSKLDVTGEYSYGRMVEEPAITVNYPGIGEIDIMALSESGVRKADTLLRVRETKFRPPERGIAQPGVPKDAADFYVILKTYEPMIGEGIAEDWLRSWAKAMGYTEAELAKVLPRIRKALEEVAAQTPTNLIGYKFTPSKSASVTKGASPSIVIHVPSSLGASVSPSLESRISEPIYPYKMTSRMRPYASQALLNVASQYASPSVRTSKSIVASGKPSIVKPSPKASVVKPSKIKPGSVKPSASKPSPHSPSVVPPSAVPPSVVPPSVVPPSVVPPSLVSPPPPSSPAPSSPGRKPQIELKFSKKQYPEIPEGSIAWKQGKLLRKGKLVDYWKYIPPPWKQEVPVSIFGTPKGAKFAGETTPEKTIQMIGEPRAKVPKDVSVDLGVVDIYISEYGRRIEYKGKGLETKVGKSLREATRGMSIPASSPMRVKHKKPKRKADKVLAGVR
jgi:hypothetical protein